MNTIEAAQILSKYNDEKPYLSQTIKEALNIAIEQLKIGDLVAIECLSLDDLAKKFSK